MQTVQLGKGWFPEESGGLNRYYHGLVSHLPSVGVGVNGLVAGSDQVVVGSAGTVESFAPSKASLPARLGRARAFARRLMTEHPDSLVVAHFALYTAPCLDLMRRQSLVVHFHGPWAGESRAEGAGAVASELKRRVEQAVYRHAARFVVLSRAFGRVLEEDYGISADRIRVVPGGVDADVFAPTISRAEARHQLGWPEDRPIILVVRRLVRRMGLEDLITSVRHVRALVPDVLVLIAGSGPLAHELELRAAVESVERQVRFLGYVPDASLPLAYRAADLSVVPSVALEGFGLVVAESLAAGTPVLVTAVGGLPETIEGFSPQCVLTDRRPEALGSGIADALLGRIPMPGAEACATHARSRFDWKVVTGKVRDVYAEAVQ